jgi:hypothetical protein
MRKLAVPALALLLHMLKSICWNVLECEGCMLPSKAAPNVSSAACTQVMSGNYERQSTATCMPTAMFSAQYRT